MTIPDSASRTRIVLDTNVVVALLVFGDPALALLRSAIDDGGCVAIADGETLAELDRVLRYPELRLSEADAAAISDRYRASCEVVAPETVVDPARSRPRLPLCRDRDDQKFLALAQRADASMLLTRDRQLLALRRRVTFAIVTPEQFRLPPTLLSG